MPIEGWIALIIILGFVLYFKFDISPFGVAKVAKTQKNRNDLIKTIFDLAQNQGGFWRIDFSEDESELKGFTIFSQNNTHKYYSFNELCKGGILMNSVTLLMIFNILRELLTITSNILIVLCAVKYLKRK